MAYKQRIENHEIVVWDTIERRVQNAHTCTAHDGEKKNDQTSVHDEGMVEGEQFSCD